MNKTESAVEVTHLPIGTVAVASDSRSQHTNRGLALLLLVEKMETARVAAAKKRRQRAKRSYGSKQEMLRDKRHRSGTKQMRGKVQDGP